MSKKIYRMLSFVEIKTEDSQGHISRVSMSDETAIKYIQYLLSTKEYMTITINAKDGEPEDAR